MSFTKVMLAVFALPLTVSMLWQEGACQRAGKDKGQSKKMNSVMTGTWGGRSVNLEVTEGGARVEYDCAHGTISGPIEPDKNGRFEVRGTHAIERPGPVREGQEDAGRPALYAGSVDDKTMTLTVTLSDTNEAVGTFTLTHGKRSRIVKCL